MSVIAKDALPAHDSHVAVERPHGEREVSVYVYEAPVRIWHWVNALCIFVLFGTGYFIGSPPPTLSGEASDHFLFGYIRLVHFAAGQIMAVAFLGRVYWAFVGNSHARQIFYIPVTNGAWWREMWHELKWYLFIENRPKAYLGHNPLAHLTMFLLLIMPSVVMILTGMALYAEGIGIESWQYALFGWVFSVIGNSMAVHTVHHLTMWTIVLFTMIHLYVAIREDIMSRTTFLSTIINGWRVFKNEHRD
jgi:Ni/Fe-hydrogenase 1 B-type cytochrome subunit